MITTNASLAALCQMAAQYPLLALDTEFVRVRSYYPHLGLIQVCFAGQVALIDPLTITDWSGFTDLLHQQSITKIFHAGSEDLDVLHYSIGAMPAPFIDTQILAAFTGHPLSLGLAALTEHYTGVRLDKSESRTDWLARPLTSRQCEYASADVMYLLPLAEKLTEQARATGWLAAAQDECRLMQIKRSKLPQPEQAWRDIGDCWQLRTRQLACLQLLAAWRLTTAQQRDLALNFVLRAEKLWQLARYQPGTKGELASLGLNGSEIRWYGDQLLALVAQAQALPADALPPPLINPARVSGFNQAVREIKALTEQLSQCHNINPGLLASRRQIIQLLSWHWQINGLTDIPELLTGWRAELLAQPLTELLSAYPLQVNPS